MICQYLVVDKVHSECVGDYNNNSQCLFAGCRLCNVSAKTVDCVPAACWGTGIYVASEALGARHFAIGESIDTATNSLDGRFAE